MSRGGGVDGGARALTRQSLSRDFRAGAGHSAGACADTPASACGSGRSHICKDCAAYRNTRTVQPEAGTLATGGEGREFDQSPVPQPS